MQSFVADRMFPNLFGGCQLSIEEFKMKKFASNHLGFETQETSVLKTFVAVEEVFQQCSCLLGQ
jgi:hypothetical protein